MKGKRVIPNVVDENPWSFDSKKTKNGFMPGIFWVGSENYDSFCHVLKQKFQQDFYKYVCLSLDESYE